MKRIFDAKKKYEEIEIPQELSSRVADAIEKSRVKKKTRGFGFYVKVLATPVAVCAAICIAIGMNGLPDYAPPIEDAEKIDTATPEDNSAVPKMASVPIEEETRAVPEAANAPRARTMPDDTQMLSDDVEILPFEEPLEMWLYSGAGAWGTRLVLNNDGTFVGNFHDANGDTVYICDFNGSFTQIEKIDDLTYSLKLSQLSVEGLGEEYFKDGVRYIKSMPYGLDSEDFVFYLPNTPISVLTEEESYWWRGDLNNEASETLSSYGLINKQSSQGFFS